MSCETILLLRSDEDNKAYVTSLYAIAIAVGYIVGPLAANPIARVSRRSKDASGRRRDRNGLSASSFSRASIQTRRARIEKRRRPPHGWKATIRQLIRRRIKTSCFATFAYGYFQASVVLFLPLYLVESKGILAPSNHRHSGFLRSRNAPLLERGRTDRRSRRPPPS